MRRAFITTARHNAMSLNVETPKRRDLASSSGAVGQKKNRPEQDLQRAAMKLLRSILPKEAFIFHVPNGGLRSAVEAAIFTGIGVRAGMPDLGVIFTGRYLGIELKAPETTGGLTIAQRQVHAELRAAGARVEVARSLDEIVAHLVAFGIPCKPHWMVTRHEDRVRREP